MNTIDASINQTIEYLLTNQPHLAFHIQTIASKIIRENHFTKIYSNNSWGCNESRSGDGSTISYTENLRKNLPLLFNKFDIKSLLDAPCGDFNWMKLVVPSCPIKYIGVDIVKPLIELNNKEYSSDNISFKVLDITSDKLPLVDLMMCRDCLFHLSYDDTKLFLQNFINSGIPYLLTTTHENKNSFTNTDIATSAFRLIDLFSSPYNFDKNPLMVIDDWVEGFPARQMCLWTREQITNCTMVL